ncbi:MAG: YqcC family protein [Bacteroidetes bacterium]|nr:YqcC family protein [Bacteroidota bacterium]
MTIYENAAKYLSQIKDELMAMQAWSATPIEAHRLIDMGAFGTKTMAFTEWLQFVLIPRVQHIIETKGDFPAQSNIAAFAWREFDGLPNTQHLCTILTAFDDLFNQP